MNNNTDNHKELTPAQGWILHNQARIQTPAPSQRGFIFRIASKFSKFLGRADVPDVITVLHINPRIFWAWLFFASRLMPFGKLPDTLREKVILRTGWNCRSRYEWGQHVEIALRCGVTAEEIKTLALNPQDEAKELDRLALQACDELCASSVISDDTWQSLSQHLNQKKMLELMILIGHYQMIAGVLNSAGLVLEPNVEQVLSRFHQQIML